MVKRIVFGLVFLGVLGLAYLGYNNWRQRRAMISGEVLAGPSESTSSDASVPLPSPGPSATPETASPTTSRSATGAPTTDSMPANPPNGIVNTGSGHFQIYRQGNLTYRINTDTGQSCILYATNDEWRKPQVYGHGCANSAPQ